jgi:hypothetical protein
VDVITSTARNEPAMVTGVAQTALALGITLSGWHLTAGQTGALEAIAAGIGAVIVAASTRPVPVPILTGGLTAILTCLVAFGVRGVTPAVVSEVNAAAVAVLAIVLRTHQTPIAPAPAPTPPPRPVL